MEGKKRKLPSLPQMPSIQFPGEEEVYEKKLGAAYWYVTHKIIIRTILTVIFIGINFLLLAYIAYLLIYNFSIYGKSYQQILSFFASNNPDYAALKETNLPAPIKVETFFTLNNRDKYDIIADISNSNAKWWASFDYQFQLDGQMTELRKDFILPGENKFINDLAVDKGNLASKAVISNIIWHKVIDFENILRDRFNIEIKNAQYLSSEELEIGNEISVNRVVFDATNLSAYNYRQVKFLVFLKSGTQIEAVNQIVADSFKSGETRNIKVTFFQNLSNITDTEILPYVNILDETSFLKF